MVFGFIPECRSASFRNQRSASPESSQETDLADFELVEDAKPYREWCVPAELVNRVAVVLEANESQDTDREGMTPLGYKNLRAPED